MPESSQRAAEKSAVRTEENLSVAEYRRDQVEFRARPFHRQQVVDPEFVFDENGDFRPHDRHETAHVARGVGRQVKDVVGSGVVFADLVAGRRKEGDQYLVTRTCFAERFDHRPSLFEFAERSGMEPCDVGSGVHRPGQFVENVLPSPHPESRFGVEQAASRIAAFVK